MKRSLAIISAFSLIHSFPTLATSADFSATVKVQNTVVLSKGEDLSFGTIRAVAQADGVKFATLTINPNPNAAIKTTKNDDGDALISVIEEGSPATFTVSDVVPNAALTITKPGTGRLESASKGAGEPQFSIDGWKFFITSGPNINTAYDETTPNLIASEKGEVEFAIGATLSTDNLVTTVPYKDVEYTGTFQIEVAY
ncbi:MAG: hypothetical protein ACJAVX_002298 [Pseudoalteromonas rhizosphaerae]|jgi:hypothetical protein|uniref:DUF4402 domain-containing protein n=1 Tax=Pseudoalteromonas neustonica TaxID=1840331 RepID=A0ABY3FAL3_9GAMM|nr:MULTISPECIES: DUF4402 domain-containing protein [Pseudoalteromonas]MBB1292683.1 DUF4402 domain-containing protein [Pseudoalteromonas sp. SR41-4]MBB1300874.1 DUF4402 domain-containing protein [Pseudoalteromonas sp. SR44-8]MBB1507302.1 DUF4402 domain-containing protein [Pseudoalteromonas sp. SG41-1]TVU81293.1 DUF4402 domain-containing protein [Pseudoalteromonas neustonica]|tara:strand:+ start:145 stop:738 length:594 start_codon:yes stop_codon:yes gene_type:complete